MWTALRHRSDRLVRERTERAVFMVEMPLPIHAFQPSTEHEFALRAEYATGGAALMV